MKKRGKSVLVLGSEGAVGRALVKRLAESHWTQEVIGIDIRKPSQKLEGLSSYIRDLSNPYHLEEFLPGTDIIFNAAAIVDIGAKYEKLHKINTDLVDFLARKLPEETQLLHISSGSIYDINLPCSYLKETSPIKATNPYELSKVFSEQALESSDHFNYIIFRPGMIYGPGATALGAVVAAIPRMLEKAAFKGKVPYFSGGPQTNWVHADDVAAAMIVAARENDLYNNLAGHVFNLAEDIPAPFSDVINSALEGLSLEKLCTIPLPPRDFLGLLQPILEYKTTFDLLNIGVKATYNLCGCGKNIIQPKIDKEASLYMTKDVVFDNSLFVEKTNFFYRYDIRTAMKDTMRWYIDNKWI